MLDDDGFLAIVDRKKDMFISGGENVYPAEIEEALADHPDLVEYAVVGMPNAQWGEVGHVAFVPRPGAAVGHDEILSHLAAKIGRFKIAKMFDRGRVPSTHRFR